MKKFTKYLFVAAMAALALVSCKKEKEPEEQKEDPKEETVVNYTFSATATSETEADLKVVADVAVPADVTVSLALGADNTIPQAALTFPAELKIAKGSKEATGKLTVDKDALEPGNGYKAALTASVDGKSIGSASVFNIDIAEPGPEPQGAVTVDGNGADWAALPADYVTELVCAEGAELNGLKSAKVFYDDKIYVLLEVTDEALAQGVADGKLRLHFFFDNGNNGDTGYKEKIDCMLEGKMTSGGDWCALSSSYYQWTGTDPTVWGGSWTAADAKPTFEFAGNGNFYECAMDYSNYPGGLADVIGMGFDIQDGNYVALGYLPSNAPVAQVVKNGADIPENPQEPEITIAIDGDFSDWDAVSAVPGDGAIKALKVALSDNKVNVFMEVEKTEDVQTSASLSFAHKVMLCFDNGDNKGDYGNAFWGGARYDKTVDIWLMQNGAPNMITWGLDGFQHKEADGETQKYEFCFNKSIDPVFSGSTLCYGAFINDQACDNSSGKEVWSGEADSRIGSAPADDQPLAFTGATPNPELVAITIDGDMSEWENVTACVTDEEGVIQVFKVTYDSENLYFYNKRTWHDGLWKASSGGYFYYEFDTDNNAETSVADVNGNTPCGGTDTWLYLYLFTGTADEPTFAEAPKGSGIATLTNITAAGTTDKTVIETEVCIPRANLGLNKGDTFRVWTWGNKSGDNLKHVKGLPIRLDK